jgi:hypothetical protein
MKVDPDALRPLFEAKSAVFERLAEKAKSMGALHHRYMAGDGKVLVIDEWESAEGFQEFFAGQAEIPELMQEAGVQGPPEINVWQPVDETPDTF